MTLWRGTLGTLVLCPKGYFADFRMDVCCFDQPGLRAIRVVGFGFASRIYLLVWMEGFSPRERGGGGGEMT